VRDFTLAQAMRTKARFQRDGRTNGERRALAASRQR
jgi:hypothetical protein